MINNRKPRKFDESFIEEHIAKQIMTLSDAKKKELIDMFLENVKIVKTLTWELQQCMFTGLDDDDENIDLNESLIEMSRHYKGEKLIEEGTNDEPEEEIDYICEICGENLTSDLSEHPLRHVFLKHFKKE